MIHNIYQQHEWVSTPSLYKPLEAVRQKPVLLRLNELEKNYSREPNSRYESKQTLSVIWEAMFHCRVQNNAPTKPRPREASSDIHIL
jgi:hypothetical protein